MSDSNDTILAYVDEFVRTSSPELIPKHMLPLYFLVKAYQSMSDDTTPLNILLEARLKERMELGMQRYGHGIQIHDDTRQWGTKRDSWMEMCEEEVIDGIIYAVAHHLRTL
jgi:hypothetical protein